MRHHNSKGWCHVPRSRLFPSAILQSKLRHYVRKIITERKDVLEVYPLIQRLVGPHKMPMFEVHFVNKESGFVEWLEQARGDMSVLIHPVTGGEETLDHTVRATWLGRELGVLKKR